MDQVEAAKWFRKAAEQGDASAQLNIGFAYANGEGVAKDQAEAVKWYRKAAEQGDYLGQRQLGFAYRFGDGVAKDQVEAYAWYNLVAVTHENAKEVREELEKTMTAQQIAEGQKRSTELSTLIEANKAKK
jgi:TPR repeat protein